MSQNIINRNDNENEILRDYMNLIRCSSPYCNCGKCIRRKYLSKVNTYDSNNKNKNNINAFENISKNEDKDNKIIPNENNEYELLKNINNNPRRDTTNSRHIRYESTQDSQKSIPPFIGRSSYELMFPDYKLSKPKKELLQKKIFEKIPFNGSSSYKENFSKFEKRYYVNRAQPIMKSDTLETKGDMYKESISREDYQPINLQRYKKINNVNTSQIKRPASIISAPYSKDSFLSSYEKAFMINNITGKKDFNRNNSIII